MILKPFVTSPFCKDTSPLQGFVKLMSVEAVIASNRIQTFNPNKRFSVDSLRLR